MIYLCQKDIKLSHQGLHTCRLQEKHTNNKYLKREQRKCCEGSTLLIILFYKQANVFMEPSKYLLVLESELLFRYPKDQRILLVEKSRKIIKHSTYIQCSNQFLNTILKNCYVDSQDPIHESYPGLQELKMYSKRTFSNLGSHKSCPI